MHALACRTLFRRLQMMHAVAVLRVLIARQRGGIMQALVTPYRAVAFYVVTGGTHPPPLRKLLRLIAAFASLCIAFAPFYPHDTAPTR